MNHSIHYLKFHSFKLEPCMTTLFPVAFASISVRQTLEVQESNLTEGSVSSSTLLNRMAAAAKRFYYGPDLIESL